ncbi:hypothetical protein L208DRAFT_1249025, partial [Tricholoma matsutake]
MPYTEIRGVRPALSSFAAQIVKAQLLGLHASVMNKTKDGLVEWANLGTSLMPTAQAALQMHQPLTFHYIHNGRACLACGILYLASCVPVDVIACNSQTGTMPVVPTIKIALKGFSDQKA